MGRKDTVTKTYMEQNTVFADAFNYFIFGGQQVIVPEQLRELDITEIVVPYGADGAGEPEQKYRDVIKSLTAMLHEMLSVKDERILFLVPDYSLHLITPAGLSDNELKKFHSTLREVLSFIKYSNDKEKMDEVVHDNFQKLRQEEIDVLNYCANVKLKLPPGEEEVDVCKAWEDMRQEAEERTLLKNLRSLMETLHLSAEQAMEALKVPEAERVELSAKI